MRKPVDFSPVRLPLILPLRVLMHFFDSDMLSYTIWDNCTLDRKMTLFRQSENIIAFFL